MEKGYQPQESAPPYPGPPVSYGGAAVGPQPGFSPQPGFPASPGAPPHVGYQGVLIITRCWPSLPRWCSLNSGAAERLSPAAPGHTTTVTQMVVSPLLRDVPGQTICPHCQQTVVTKIEHKAGLITWAICCGLAVFGCLLCCCFPFCMDSCQDVEHSCPICQKVIYIHKRL
ncbi:cell death-inducing p53-target protein 1-like isoform X2 [Lampris incognitus]|uniref:cell death-inducing p53-target protein 1-like isoform X2 n=1 Tax=Lampris incognitus TaxID=2546036 RepID=UPI0024B482EB|nr:cell death-inducing p53-target protein 1-like isoform X2 [Lampris incognitus]